MGSLNANLKIKCLNIVIKYGGFNMADGETLKMQTLLNIQETHVTGVFDSKVEN